MTRADYRRALKGRRCYVGMGRLQRGDVMPSSFPLTFTLIGALFGVLSVVLLTHGVHSGPLLLQTGGVFVVWGVVTPCLWLWRGDR